MTKRVVKKAVFPVGGMGTRFLPATKSCPKEMLPILDRPLILYAVEEALSAGIEDLIFITGRGKTAIEDFFDFSYELETTLAQRGKTKELELLNQLRLSPGNIVYIRQQEPLGLGHAVWCARHVVGDEPFAVLLADDLITGPTPALKELIDLHDRLGGQCAAVMDVPMTEVDRYGILDIEADHGTYVQAKSVIEKPHPSHAPSCTAIVGRYILDSKVFDLLEEGALGAGGEIQLTDALSPARIGLPLYGQRFSGKRYDCGQLPGVLEATVDLALERPDCHNVLSRILETLKNKR